VGAFEALKWTDVLVASLKPLVVLASLLPKVICCPSTPPGERGAKVLTMLPVENRLFICEMDFAKQERKRGV